jgi:hypothetical protein
VTATNNEEKKPGGITVEQGIQLMKEVVTALLGVIIVGYTLVMGWKVFSFVGDQQKMSDAKDILLLMLGLAGVVIGYYFGRVPADARATQAQQQADSAHAHAERVSTEANAMAEQIDHVLEGAPSGAAARGAGSKSPAAAASDLTHIRDKLREVANRGRRTG